MSPLPIPFSNAPIANRRVVWLQRWLALAALVLIAATWRLWTTSTEFPRIPWFSWLCDVPGWLDLIALAGLVVALLSVLVLAPWRDSSPVPRRRFAITATLALSAGTLLLLDQHRLQPWAYQFAWIILVLSIAPPARALMLLRLLTVGIYFWSVLSKFDATFLATTGPDLIRGLWETLSLNPRVIDGDGAAHLAWGLPLGELAVAVLLALPATRRFGLLASIGMHGLLLVILGPWGLNHEPGVLLWNLYFIGQNILLFGRRIAPEPIAPRHWGIAETGVALALLLPAFEPFGRFDHWPAWAVYAPGAERVTLLVDATAAGRLPESLQSYLGPPQWQNGRRVFRTDLWSLQALSAPIYPQGRFRAAVALAILKKYPLDKAAMLIVESQADRLTGRRTRQEFSGLEDIKRHAASYWINTRSRQ